MALAVTIADAQDGTGGTATVSGSTGGTTNTLYRAEFNGSDGVPLNWVSMGSRSGDGTIAVSTGPMRSYYLWYVSNLNGSTTTVSPVVLQALTDTTYTAVRTRVAEAVRDRLKLLSLSDIPPASVLLLTDADDPAHAYPGCKVFRDPTPDQYAGGTNIRDDVGYPVQVVFADNRGVSAALLQKWDLWRELAERALRNQRLSGVTEVYTCLVEPARFAPRRDPNGPLPPAYQSMVSAFTVRAMSREVRGIQA